MVSFHDRNVVAIDLLCQGFNLQARSIWCTALAELTAEVAIAEDEHLPDAQQPRILPNIPLVSTITLNDALVSDTQGDTVFSMYNKVFLLMAIDAPQVAKALVILYNMALTHHLLGLQTGKSHFLQQALRLYGKAEAIFRSDVPPALRSETQILQMATYNNMGHIFSRMLDFQSATVALERLRSIMNNRLQLQEQQRPSTMEHPTSFAETLDFSFFMEAIVMSGNLFLIMAPAA